MAHTNNRKLPAGIQSFKVIREEGYLYVDKTYIVKKLVNGGSKHNYLSRGGANAGILRSYFNLRFKEYEKTGLKVATLID